MKKNSRVYAAIHLDALEQNLENMKKNLTPGTRMIGVITANAYGHGAVPVAHLMEGKDYIWGYAVANVPEAEELRDAGLKKPILILGYVFPEDYQTLVKLDIRPAVFDYETAEKISQEAQKAGKVHPIHLAFDTGMTRIGFRHPKESLPEILRISKLPGNYDRRCVYSFCKSRRTGSDLCPSAIRKLSGIFDFAGRSRYSDSDPSL